MLAEQSLRGPQAQRFMGVQQNTDICHRIKEACSVTLAK